MIFRRAIRFGLVYLFSSAIFAAAQGNGTPDSLPQLPQDPGIYVRASIKHELACQDNDHSHWRYRFHREDEKYNYDRDVIDARDGEIARTILLNGLPLNADDRQRDEDRMKKLVDDPETRAKRDKRMKDDDAKARQMLQAIPDAFIFKYDGEENGMVRLTFTPNPHYVPPTRELQVFRAMTGKVWISRSPNRLAGIEGTLFEDVTFGWGLLGRLNKGGTFKVKQRDVGEGHWVVTSLDVNMVGRALLFKTINARQKEYRTDFHRLPDSITMAEAYQLLEKSDNSSVSANNQQSKGESAKTSNPGHQ